MTARIHLSTCPARYHLGGCMCGVSRPKPHQATLYATGVYQPPPVRKPLDLTGSNAISTSGPATMSGWQRLRRRMRMFFYRRGI